MAKLSTRKTPNVQEPRVDFSYVVEDQVGFLLRLASQRHASIFASKMLEGLTSTQFTALIKLRDVKICSQNELGRLAAMDAPTIKGVVERLSSKGFVEIKVHPDDKRRRSICLSKSGRDLLAKISRAGSQISNDTLQPISKDKQEAFLSMLRLIGERQDDKSR